MAANRNASLKQMVPELKYLLLAAALLGITGGMHETVFNNYLDDMFAIDARTRGFLEFPRELPGFLVAVFSGVLFFIVEARLAVISVIAIGLGLIGLGFLSPSFGIMVFWMMLWSSGQHLFMPLEQTLAINVSKAGREGQRLGQLAGLKTGATIIGAGLVWLGLDYINLGYRSLYLIAAVAAFLAALSLGRIQPVQDGANAQPRAKYVLKKKYWLYYVLACLFGARKQVFITFAPWVLIRVFDQPASTIAKLWILSAVLGIIIKPLLGWFIDRIGERLVLMTDAILLFLICLGYGYGPTLGPGQWGVWLIYLCYVLDQVLFAVNMARTTYLSKIADSRSDLTPTLSLGVSLDHAVSMTIPAIGGLVWARYGYPAVFLGAAFIAIISLIMCAQIDVERQRQTGQPANA